ncbi:hypothetical protein [Dapis sp. BLCC M229]|uniref:hypothetical protein n=1 Tax=Dapis sp. BLCC M229 TaxID=3400188 RepID=UPI003CEBAAB7
MAIRPYILAVTIFENVRASNGNCYIYPIMGTLHHLQDLCKKNYTPFVGVNGRSPLLSVMVMRKSRSSP